MRSHGRLFALLGILASAGLFACTGGGGSLGDGMTTWQGAGSSYEPAKSSREGAESSREGMTSSQDGIGTSGEPGPGAQGNGGAPALACAGTFRCIQDGDDDDDELTFTATGAGCTVSVGETTLLLASDGTIRVNGQNVGTWQATGSGFTGTVQNDRITCTRGGSGRGDGQGKGPGGNPGGNGGVPVGDDDAPPPPPPPPPDHRADHDNRR